MCQLHMYMYVQFEYSNSVYTCCIAPSLDPNDFILVHTYTVALLDS